MSAHFTKQAKVGRGDLRVMRTLFRSLIGPTSNEGRARLVQSSYPHVSVKTLEDYANLCMNLVDPAFDALEEGRISLGIATQLLSMDPKVQEFLLAEVFEQNLTPSQLVRVKGWLREGQSMAEALGRATGKIAAHTPRRSGEKPHTLDSMLDSIAKAGSRWRAQVALAMEAVTQQEGAGGIHMDLFEKVWLLRHLIGEQYEFVDQKVRRYINVLKKRANGNGAGGAQASEEEDHGSCAGTDEAGNAGGQHADGAPGQAVQDRAGEGEGAGR